jgi:Uma2 family endonuclease
VTVSEATYRQVALEDPTGGWEWVRGFMRRKPCTTVFHGEAVRGLQRQLILQLNPSEFSVGGNVRVWTPTPSYLVPDVTVLPRAYFERRLRDEPRTLEVYDEPMPLVAEVWSPPTGDYDVDNKLGVYRQREDLHVWRIHPYEHTLITWVRQPDGIYVETLYTSGIVRPTALPNVVVNLDALFD